MPNRFQSIVDAISDDVLKELKELYPKLSHGVVFYIRDGKLYGVSGMANEEFFFEEGDPDSEAMVLLLNNLRWLTQSLTGTRE